MPHVRTQIRYAAVAILTGLTTTADRVHVNRLRAIAAEACPAIVVLMGDEPEFQLRDYGRTIAQDRKFQLRIKLTAAGDTADDVLDQMAAEVEAAFMASESAFTLGGLVKRGVFLAEISEPEIEDETTPRVASMVMTYRGQYRTLANDPTATVN